jgi:hypothetical protein
MATPKVISESKVKFSDDVKITVCLLDDGRRIIPKDDMLKALKFLGFNESEINRIMTDKLNKI